MAYDEELARRVREELEDQEGYSEKKMFGGICFMINGNMMGGVLGDLLMVRVGKERYEEALEIPHCREMDFTGRPLRGLVLIEPEGFEEDEDFLHWVTMGLDYAGSLPPKRK